MATDNNLLICKVECDNTAVRPIFCDFQNGKIPEGFENHMVSQVYRDADNELLVAVAANEQLYTDKIIPNKTHNTFIAIPNSKGTKVRLVAVDYAKLAPHMEEDDGNTTAISLNTSLDFTDKKAKRIQNEKLKLKTDIEKIKDHLTEAAASVQVEEFDLNASISESNYRPKINTAAEHIEDVYSVHDLVSERVLESLTLEAERIFNNPDEDIGTCEFVAKILDTFEDIDSEQSKTACVIWLYIDCLIQFYGKTTRTVTTKKYTACPYSELASNFILENFTISGPSGRNRPNIVKDKCLCYILVLCVLNSNYSMDITSLAEQLHMTTKRVIELAKILRLTVNSTKVSLKLPLPVLMEGRPKSGKRK